LASYCLFFIILWFTWLHVTLLDVRFSVDSVYERVCKSIHFIVMAAFSSVSTTWNPLTPKDAETIQALRTMTLALMFSRFVLMIQYFVVMLYARRKKKYMLPLALHALVMGIAGGVYLGLYFAFTEANPAKSYVGWYITAMFEATCVFGISSIWRFSEKRWLTFLGKPGPWKVVSFADTHLVERMGLLTLIILGEGIIVMLKAINAIVKGTDWTAGLAGVVIAALGIIYLLWMFYFDYNPKHGQYGVLKQQFWTLLHFPFHLAIVLSMEGLRQLSTLYGLTTYINVLYSTPPDINNPADVVNWFKAKFAVLYVDGTSKYIMQNNSTLTANITILETLSSTDTTYLDAVYDLDIDLFVGTMEYYGMKAAKPAKGQAQDYSGEGKLLDITRVFDLVYEYYFISFGIVFLIFGIFTFLVRPHRNIYDYLAVSIRVVVAIIMFGMIGLFTLGSDTAYHNYLYSRWPISQVCLILVGALVLDKALNYVAFKRSKAKRDRTSA